LASAIITSKAHTKVQNTRIFWGEKMIDIVFWTGLLSFITQYCALMLVTIFIIDFFSYKSKKALLISTSYFILLPVILLVVASFLLQMYANGILREIVFQHCYRNILLSFTVHVSFGLLIFCFYLKNIISGIVSLATNL